MSRRLKTSLIDVSLCQVLYKPDWQVTGALARSHLEALDACAVDGELLMFDNSPSPVMGAVHLAAAEPRVRYIWNQGYNVYLAGAFTKALETARGRHLVYACASHGLVNDPTWLADIVAPLADEQVALAGHVLPCEFNRVARMPDDIIEPQIHVQGGLWAARIDLLRTVGFDTIHPMCFCDVDLSRRCLAAGYELASVPSLISVPAGVISDPERYKYVHDYR